MLGVERSMHVRSPLLGYYLKVGLRSLRRNPVLTALIVVGIALGVGASMATLTVLFVMGSDLTCHFYRLTRLSGRH